MDNFNLRKFLTEKKLTTNSRLIKENEYKEEAALNVTASAKTLKDIIYQLLDDGHIQPETADDLLNAVSNSPSDDVYEADEDTLHEALNKELKAFGPDLQKRLGTLGLKAGVFKKQPDSDMFKRIQSDTSLAYIEYMVVNGHESIKIYSSKVNQDKVEKAMGYFNLDDTQYGPEKDAGWVLKNAINKNPGDIMRSKVGVSNGLANVSIYRFTKGNYSDVKTTDKATGKTDYLATAAESKK